MRPRKQSAIVSKQKVARWIVCLLTTAHCLLSSANAQDAETPPPPPAKKGAVRITFLPPPMEGTLSLGIYDKAGKLVRVLAREASEKDFAIGLNGLITQWDGRDDGGRVLPAGLYSARGYSVGAVEVEGVAYHCNDWMLDDESPRIRRVLSLELRKSGRLVLWAEGPDGKPHLVRCDQAGEFAGEIPPDPQVPALAVGDAPPAPATAQKPASFAAIVEGKVVIKEGAETRPLKLAELTKPLDASLGRDGVWIIDQVADRIEVKEYQLDGEFRRRLTIDPAEPAPRRIFASRTSDLIFLIEEKPDLQRVRGLALETPPATAAAGDSTTSTWKTVLTKTIIANETFPAVASRLGRILPFIPRDKFTVNLLPNPLLRDALTSATVTIDFGPTGSFLKTLDGLPLRRITEAPFLKWAVIGQEGSGKQLTIFQSDGAAVEEFKARKLANMMAFDAGEVEWAGK
ncbi:MAG: hypothetical protein WCF18_03685 [Chthoniobacteraceae bacterium]